MTNVTEKLTLTQKTIKALHDLNGNEKTKQLVRDSELNDMLERVQKEVF